MVVGPTYVRGRTLDLLMTDVPDLVHFSVEASIGNSDHSSLSAVTSMAQLVSLKKVFLKHQVNWNTVCGAMQDLPWRNIWSADNPVEVFMSICCGWLEVLFQPRSSVYVTGISLGLMINAGML